MRDWTISSGSSARPKRLTDPLKAGTPGRPKLTTIRSRSDTLLCSTMVGFTAEVFNVMIASPGDTLDGRDCVEAVLAKWNQDRSRSESVVFLPLRWETDAIPEMEGDGQSVINHQLVDQSDVVVALFHSRLGVTTDRAQSGTAEEIERARDRGARVHVYFSGMAIDRCQIDPTELSRLAAYRERLQEGGLLGSYSSFQDLASKVRTALEHDLRLLRAVDKSNAEGTPIRRLGADLKVTFDNEPGKRGADYIRVSNRGPDAARDVQILIESSDYGVAPEVLSSTRVESISSGDFALFRVAMHIGVSNEWTVHLRWSEGETPHEDRQTVVVS